MGIKVVSIGPDAAATNSTAAALYPSTFFSALGRLTGSVDPTTGEPLVLSTSASQSQLTSSVLSAIQLDATKSLNITLKPGSLPAGLTLSPSPGTATNVEPGETTTFYVTLSVSSVPFTGTFNASFVDAATGTVLGTVPFQINLPGVPTSDPPTVVSGQRIGRGMQPTKIVVTYSTAMNASSAQNLNDYVLKGPAGAHSWHSRRQPMIPAQTRSLSRRSSDCVCRPLTRSKSRRRAQVQWQAQPESLLMG